MNFIISLLLMTFCNNFVFANDCIVERDYPIINHFISLLKEKWEKFKTIQIDCESFFEGKDIPHEHVYRKFNFIMSGENFYYGQIRTDNINKEDQKSQEENDNPKNLLEEFLLKKFHNNRKEKSISYYDGYIYAHYLYQGQYSVRHIFYKGNEQLIYHYDNYGGELSSFGDPRILLGAGIYYKNEKQNIPLPFFEFLEMEGPYSYQEREGHIIIWHQAHARTNIPIQQQLEFWFDKNENLVKIREVSRYRFIFPNDIQKIEKIIGEKVPCDKSQSVHSEWIFSNFHPIWNFPLQMERIHYKAIFENEKEREIEEKFKLYESGKISNAEWAGWYYLLSGKKNIPTSKMTLLVNETTLKINEPVDDRVFIAPLPDKSVISPEEMTSPEIKQSWYRRYTGVIFVGGCIAFTLILMFLTRRYLGWGM